MRYPFARSHFLWDEIDGDFLVSGGYVGFNLLSSAETTSRRRLLGFQRAFMGFDVAIQARSYRMDAESLLEWLTAHRNAELSR